MIWVPYNVAVSSSPLAGGNTIAKGIPSDRGGPRVDSAARKGRVTSMSAHIFQRILVADDGSPDGERAADVGVKLGAKLHAEVILLGVVEPPNVQAEGEGLPIEDPSTCRRGMEERFERFLNMGSSLGVRMMVEIVTGQPAAQIRRRAEADQVDLIILGRRNISRARRWFEGSTSEAVLRDATCSIMVAR